MKTIRRNSKTIRSILAGGYTAKEYTLNNGFTPADCKLELVKKEYETFRFAKAYEQNGIVTIEIHSNCWYKLTPQMVAA